MEGGSADGKSINSPKAVRPSVTGKSSEKEKDAPFKMGRALILMRTSSGKRREKGRGLDSIFRDLQAKTSKLTS